MGPCEIHKQHAHTIGPDGSLYACPGFAGDARPVDRPHRRPAGRRARRGGASASTKITAWEECNDCAFIPVCAGGCIGRRAHRARRHEQAELSQAELRGWRRHAGTAGRARDGARLGNVSTSKHDAISRRKEHERERQESHKEKGHAAPMAGGRFARPPAVRLLVFGKTQQISTVRGERHNEDSGYQEGYPPSRRRHRLRVVPRLQRTHQEVAFSL